jgi:NADP-dependent 3-hydroxy acid dehydrogenase YdfG
VRKALIIGGTTGVGAALAQLMSKNIEVTAVGRQEFDVRTTNYDTDLSEYDYLVLSCGVDPRGDKIHLEQEWNDIETILYTNLIGQIKFTHSYLKQRVGKWSKVVFIGSAHNGDRILQNRLSYGLTRFAQRAYVNALRHELQDPKHGLLLVRVGKARTNLLKNRLLDSWTPELDDQYYSDAHLSMEDIKERVSHALFDDEHYIQEIVISTKPI